jgi:hypothetical protein
MKRPKSKAGRRVSRLAKRGDRAEDAPLARPVAATRTPDGGEHNGGDSAAGGSGERGYPPWWISP